MSHLSLPAASARVFLVSVAAVSSAAVHAWDERASSSRPTMQFHGPRLNAGSSSGFKCIEQSYGGQVSHRTAPRCSPPLAFSAHRHLSITQLVWSGRR